MAFQPSVPADSAPPSLYTTLLKVAWKGFLFGRSESIPVSCQWLTANATLKVNGSC
jgi:hypothetical protein